MKKLLQLQSVIFGLVLTVIATSFNVEAANPPAVKPIQNFELERYLGTWYEIARIDNSFEEGLSNVTATYSLRKDGVVKVVNKGFDEEEQEWDEAVGRAYFEGEPNVGFLEVTFFWPFYADYIVFEIDQENYSYAFVASDTSDYLWLLAKTPTVAQAIIDRFLRIAKEKNFKTDELLFVSQQRYLDKQDNKNSVSNISQLDAGNNDVKTDNRR